jgi:hypothetical protein
MSRSANSSLSSNESNTSPNYWPRAVINEENPQFSDRIDEVITLPRSYRRPSDSHNDGQETDHRQGQAFTSLSESLRRPSPFSIPITESMSMSSIPTSSSEELEPGLASDPREPVVGEEPRPTLSELLGPETAAGDARQYSPDWRPRTQPRFLIGFRRRWWSGSDEYSTGDRHAGSTESQPRDLSSTIRSRAQTIRAAASRSLVEAPSHQVSQTYSSSSGSSASLSSPNRALPSFQVAPAYPHRTPAPPIGLIPNPSDASRTHRFPIHDQSDNDENQDAFWPPSVSGPRPRWADSGADPSYSRAMDRTRRDPQGLHGREDEETGPFANQYGGNDSIPRTPFNEPSPINEDRNGDSSPERRRTLPFGWVTRSRTRDREVHMERVRRERERGEERTRMALSERIAQRFGPSSDDRLPDNGLRQAVNERFRRNERIMDGLSTDSSREHDYRRSGRVGMNRDDRPPSRTHSRIDRFASNSERGERHSLIGLYPDRFAVIRHISNSSILDPNHPGVDGSLERSYIEYLRERNIRTNETGHRRMMDDYSGSLFSSLTPNLHFTKCNLDDIGRHTPPFSAARSSVEYNTSHSPWSVEDVPDLIGDEKRIFSRRNVLNLSNTLDREPSPPEYATRPRPSSPSPSRPVATLHRLRTRMYSTRPGASNSLVSEAAYERRRRHARAQLLSELRSDVESPPLHGRDPMAGDHDMDDSSPWNVHDEFDWLIDPASEPRSRSAILNENVEESRNLSRPGTSSLFEIPPPRQSQASRDQGYRSSPWSEAARANARSTQDRYRRAYEIAPYLYRDSQDEPLSNPSEVSSRRTTNNRHHADETNNAVTRIVDDLSPDPGDLPSSQVAAMFSSPESPTFLDSNILPNHMRRSVAGPEAAPSRISSAEFIAFTDNARDLDERPSVPRSPFPEADLGARARLRSSLGSPDVFRPPSPMVEDRAPPRQPLPPIPPRPSASTPQERYSFPASYRNIDLNAYHEGPMRASLQRLVEIDRIQSRTDQQSVTNDNLRSNATSSHVRLPSMPSPNLDDWVPVNPPGAASPPPVSVFFVPSLCSSYHIFHSLALPHSGTVGLPIAEPQPDLRIWELDLDEGLVHLLLLGTGHSMLPTPLICHLRRLQVSTMFGQGWICKARFPDTATRLHVL